MHTTSTRHAAFTLIELAIVLVIIGLIVGSVLVGRDLIKAAEMRATVSQFEKLLTGIQTFRAKYGYLPGDIPSRDATQAGLFAITGANANLSGYGNGDGILQGAIWAAQDYSLGELNIFYRQLTDAALIEGSYGVQGAAALNPADGSVASNLTNITASLLYPTVKFRKGTYIYLGRSQGEMHWFFVHNVTNVSTGGIEAGVPGVTSAELWKIDTMVDDGRASSGRVQASFTFPGSDGCVQADGSTYDVKPANVNNLSCFMSYYWK